MTVAAAALFFTLLSAGAAQTAYTQDSTSRATHLSPMTHHSTGTFDVTLAQQPLADPAADATLSRRAMTKTFHGGLDATSRGEMLSAMTGTKGSAGYVAMEHVTGTLDGQAGAFTLQHSATMNRGTPSLVITVVPDSGTGQLTGLSGTMTITIAPGGQHTYDFAYTLPQP